MQIKRQLHTLPEMQCFPFLAGQIHKFAFSHQKSIQDKQAWDLTIPANKTPMQICSVSKPDLSSAFPGFANGTIQNV